jgi:hypothetical protein
MATYPKVRCAKGQLTTAQVNAASGAGTVIVANDPQRTITVVDGWLRAIGGAAGGATVIMVEDTAGVDAFTMAVGGLTENAVARVGLATHSTNTNVLTALTKGKGLRIGRTVSNLTTATAIDYCILYTVDGN